jgi:hypothetical protein
MLPFALQRMGFDPASASERTIVPIRRGVCYIEELSRQRLAACCLKSLRVTLFREELRRFRVCRI